MQNLLFLKTKNFYQKHKIFILSILIFSIVFICLGLPYTNWWFNGDDFHGIYLGYKANSWKDLFYFFYEGHTNQDIGPTNFLRSNLRTSFFGTFYRPLYCAYLTIQYWIFGTNAYHYLLTNVFFHAINTVILFNIFLWFINYYPAFLCTMMFAFHPQIAYRFGAIVNLHYYINVMLMLFVILIFKKYLDTKQNKYNIFACILFATSLFTRETSIVLPAIIFLGTYLYQNQTKKISFSNFFKQFFIILKTTLGLWLVVFGFLMLRAYLYPVAFKISSQNFNPFLCLINRFPEFQVFVYDFLGLSWLPWGHKIIRGSIVIPLLLLLFWLFIKNTKKIYILYFLLSAALILWPSYVGAYCHRYFYETHPFILLALIFLFKYYNGKLIRFKKILLIFLSLAAVFYISFAIENLLRRETKMDLLCKATEKLIKNPKIQNRSLCIFGYPLDGCGEHNAEIFWIMLDNPKHPMFFDSSTAIVQADSNIVQTTSWKNIISEYFNQNYVDIVPVKNGFRFISKNPKKVSFYLNNGCSLGKKIINKIQKIKNEKVVTDFTLLIDQKYLKEKPIFIKWNYKKKKFIIMKNNIC